MIKMNDTCIRDMTWGSGGNYRLTLEIFRTRLHLCNQAVGRQNRQLPVNGRRYCRQCPTSGWEKPSAAPGTCTGCPRCSGWFGQNTAVRLTELSLKQQTRVGVWKQETIFPYWVRKTKVITRHSENVNLGQTLSRNDNEFFTNSWIAPRI